MLSVLDDLDVHARSTERCGCEGFTSAKSKEAQTGILKSSSKIMNFYVREYAIPAAEPVPQLRRPFWVSEYLPVGKSLHRRGHCKTFTAGEEVKWK